MAAFLARPEVHFVPEPFRPVRRKPLGIWRFAQHFFGDLPNTFLLGIFGSFLLGISRQFTVRARAYGDLPNEMPNGFLLGISWLVGPLFDDG
jgi:hypothetical protein